jgi:GTP-binding protein
VSVLTGWHLDGIWPAVRHAYDSFSRRVPTPELNRLVQETVAVTPPPTVHGRVARFYYATQVGIRPPHFVFFVNNPDLVHFSYERHLENAIRDHWDFTGTPLRFTFRERRPRPS